MEKAEARAEIRRRIEAIPPADRALKSEKIVERLLSLPAFKDANAVMLFVPMPDEADVAPVISEALKLGKIVLLPKCDPKKREIVICRIGSMSELALGHYGIMEPKAVKPFPPERIDFLLVPARAFDERGNRLGRGAGYYDKFMDSAVPQAVRCGVAFEEQVLPDIPHDEHDLPVHILVTDARVRTF